MLIELLYELKEQIDRHGIRVGLFLTLYVMYRKELRNRRLDMRDEAMFLNQKILMDHLGIGSQYHGQPVVSHKDLANYKPLQQYYSAVISQVEYLYRRRVGRMNKVNWLTLIPAVFGAIKLILQPFNIDLAQITDEQVNSIANGAAAVFTIIGIFMSHQKGATINGSVAKRPTDTESAI